MARRGGQDAGLEGRRARVQEVLRRPLAGLDLRIAGTDPGSGVRVGVVGSRRATSEQLDMTRDVAAGLVARGAIVVSGGAAGVDATAHLATLRAGGITLCVLPSGLGAPSPPRHAALFRQIAASGGAVLSPFGDETRAILGYFHLRNRVICHVVDALIVICADARSGSLHCARQAWALGLPVFAVPWTRGCPNSRGTNEILADGGRAVVGPDGASSLVTRLQEGEAAALLQREPELRAAEVAQRADRAPSSPPRRQVTIDEALSARQTCAAPASGTPPVLSAPEGCAHDLVAAIGELLCASAQGAISLEAAVQQTGRPRAEVAATLLRLTLDGQLRRAPQGRYRR